MIRGSLASAAGEPDPLPHPTGELVDAMIREVLQTDGLQARGGPLLTLVRGDPLELEAKLDVLGDAEPRHQSVLLKDDAALDPGSP